MSDSDRPPVRLEAESLRSGRVYVAGHRGLVGSALVRRLEALGCRSLLTRSRDELDLMDRAAVRSFFEAERPEYVFLAAARVGGIQANNRYPAEFIHDNLVIQNNVVDAAWQSGCNRLLFLGSSCIYPRLAEQPMAEEALLTGPLEATNEPYSVAKIAGIKLCESYNRQYGTDFRSVMPTNLYGPNDNFDLENSHVIPALIRKFHEARVAGRDEVVVWGTGKPRREFLYVEDMADACLHVMSLSPKDYARQTTPMRSHLNIGTGEDVTIAELAGLVRDVVGFEGELVFDTGKPDGTPRKCLDVSRIRALGWRHGTSLRDGLARTYQWYLEYWGEELKARREGGLT